MQSKTHQPLEEEAAEHERYEGRVKGRRNIWTKEDLDDVFIVAIKRIDHGTLQGRARWTNYNLMQCFRSELELLGLLRDALEERNCE